jgi:xanthine dehydrogenase YagR molybdenum-binding subunit
MTALMGEARERVDAYAKVTGRATYTAEQMPDRLAHAVIVLSTIASGRIRQIDPGATRRVTGFIDLITHENSEPLNGEITGRPGLDKRLPLLNDDLVRYDRQPIAVVIAETLDAAREAAAALRVSYDSETPVASMDDSRAVVIRPKQTQHGEPPEIVRGAAPETRASAPFVFSATYVTPIENHNPIEPHASVAAWDGDRLTIFDATQGVFEERRKLAAVFGIPPENVRVVSPYVGGAFGNKGSVWSHQCLAATAARRTGRPVKLVLDREHMFANTGHRSRTLQHIAFGAQLDGTVLSCEHDVSSDTSTFDQFVESAGEYTAMAYAFPNVNIRHRLVRMNVGTPTFMRAPGEATGTYALEAALDELAFELGIDPIELRLKNYAETDPGKERPFSSKYLRDCYRRGAELISWSTRDARPRSMRDGRELIGIGMAGGAYPSQIFAASASVEMHVDGSVVVRSGTHELGQGSYTALAQIAAGELNIDPARVRMELGDTDFPSAMNSGGSTTIASVGSAIALACRELRRQHETVSGALEGPLSARASYTMPEKRKAFSSYSYAAQFAEVGVDPDLGTVRVRRMVGVFDVGRVVNARLARSQCIGGMTMGIGMALLEETRVDPRTVRIMNANLGDYLVPTNADVGRIDVEFVGGYDGIVDEIGTKPVGEIGICGAAAAVANAVFHATGRRVRDLPIRPARLR